VNLHQVRYFLALYEIGNFTKAAAHCAVTQPALTRAIKQLEEELGAVLFARGRMPIQPTNLGRLMRPHFAQILEGAWAAKTTANAFLKLESAAVTVGAMCTIGPQHFIPFLNDFSSKYPAIDLTLREGTSQRLVESMLTGDIDIALLAQPGPFDARLRPHPLFRERFAVAFPFNHRFQAKAFITPEDMAGESYLSRINCEFQNRLTQVCGEHGVEIIETFRSEREDWIQMMVIAGMGVCFIPEFATTVPGLQTRPLARPEVVREVSLVTLADGADSPAVAAFLSAVQCYSWPVGPSVPAASD